ncbi:MAG: BatA domain-containing protein [Flavobacteriaceae bacterium]|nr:BatA domain-containing protein [Flavobacteriaceae bacterium]
MQFQNPEILYFLPVLIIPILVHLFQLQKFEKVLFTNVAFLKKITQENRKSSTLKKWLILTTRTLLLFAILFAFSQPYFSNKNNDTNQHTFIYLDNSLSLDTKGERGNLLKITAQNIIESAAKNDSYSLLTNDDFYENLNYTELKNQLLNLKNTAKNSNLEQVLLKINSLKSNKSNTSYKNILISDFQNTYNSLFTNVTSDLSLIKLNSNTNNNISIDSLYLDSNSGDNLKINVVIKNQGSAKENIPIAIYNKEKLLNKQSFNIEENSKNNISFNIKKIENLQGKISVTFSDTFSFDNTFYFTLNTLKKNSVLCIGKPSEIFAKIYTSDEFNYTESTLLNLNYNSILNQDLIILNELENLPEVLNRSINQYLKNGGTLVIIPNTKTNIGSYNNFLKSISSFRITNKVVDSLKVTKINFDHPVFKNVFSNKVSNFQYPSVSEYYANNLVKSIAILNFEDNSPFVSQINTSNQKVFWITTSLSSDKTNFSKSPLIVPLFYNFGKLSFKNTKLYYEIGDIERIDIDRKLNKDEILIIANKKISFIPQQQTYQSKVSLDLQNQLNEVGFYSVLKKQDTIKTLAFNSPRNESSLQFLDLDELSKDLNNIKVYSDVKQVFTELNKKNEVHWLWQWFLALAIVSLLTEILILKFYNP